MDIQNFLYIIFFICIFHSTRINLRAMIIRGSAGRICHIKNVKSYMWYLQHKCGGYIPCGVTVNTHTIVNWKNSAKCYRRLWNITNMRLPMIIRGSAGRICHIKNVKSYMWYLQQYTKIIKMFTLKTYFS
jgi:hypothetical protein